jgi:hypothetical protein
MGEQTGETKTSGNGSRSCCCGAFIGGPILLFILFFAFMNLNVTYDYAVDRRTTKLPYRTYYYNDAGRDFDFNTVLFTLMGNMEGIVNYATFTVFVAHPHQEVIPRNNLDDNLAEIVFTNFTVDDPIEMVPDSVALTLRRMDGQVIPHRAIINELADKPQSKHRTHRYRKVYEKKHLPDEIIEEISFEVIIGGEKKRLEYQFPLKKVPHYSAWDVLMGV